ncbi:MAG TPA: ATP-binding protein [Candidatus Paceibacterota bacterium]
MFDANILKEIALEQKQYIQNKEIGIPREKLREVKPFFELPHAVVIAGIRRVGKSTLLAQIIKEFYEGQYYYFNFEDERLLHFKSRDFNALYEILLELFDEKKVFFFDEIQNIQGWEKFVRRMQDRGYKFFLSGSNATLLSRELGTALTGRHVAVSLYPFSFREFLAMQKFEVRKNSLFQTSERAKIRRLFQEYLQKGGMPEYLQYERREILRGVYDDILYRDIAARYEIKEIGALRELALYYISNIGAPVSFHKLKDMLKLGSTNTVKAYTTYLENSFLLFPLNRYSYSVKQQYIAPKKIYCIDNGLASAVAFAFSPNKGRFLENLVFVELRRRGKQLFYYKTKNNLEVDFLATEGKRPEELIQVCWSLSDKKTKEREIKALQNALAELRMKEGYLLTSEEREKVKVNGCTIHVKPVWEWCLE